MYSWWQHATIPDKILVPICPLSIQYFDFITFYFSIITNTGTNIGIGFAIPVNYVLPLIRGYVNTNEENEDPLRVWDGITVDMDENDLVRVKDILEESPGYVGGLRKDDRLLAINDVSNLTVEKYFFCQSF